MPSTITALKALGLCLLAGCDQVAALPPTDGPTLSGMHFDRQFSNSHGTRSYRVYVPSGYHAGVPLFMVLHGCTQTADQIEAASRFSELAEKRTFVVAYPQQDSSANPIGCWNWFQNTDQMRNGDETSLLAGIAQATIAEWSLDPARVFVAGGSAGGAMAGNLGATYPDVFRAIAILSGCEFGGYPCGQNGGPDPMQQGQRAFTAMGSYARAVPVIIFHGDADTIAYPINGDQVTEQWLATDAAAGAKLSLLSHHDGQVAGGRSYSVDDYGAIQHWVVHGMGHAWPGGASGQAFTDPGGPDATQIIYDFCSSR